MWGLYKWCNQYGFHALYGIPMVQKLYQYSSEYMSISTPSVVEDLIEFVQVNYFYKIE